MGWYTHVSTCFSLDYAGCVPRRAQEFIDKENKKEFPQTEIIHMFEEMKCGKGFFIGCKGSLFNWGYVGNYTEAEPFVETLKEFLEGIRGLFTEGFLEFDHAIVFYEAEQSEQAIAYEIMPEDDDSDKPLIIKKHKCPFCWMQM